MFYGGGLVAKLCLSLVTLRTVACQSPLSMGFSRQEYWSGLPFMVRSLTVFSSMSGLSEELWNFARFKYT